MYVANYENGGFEIFSNDARLPMVLVKSQTGFFIPNNPADNSPFADYISDSADCLQKIGIDSSAEPTGLWDVYSTSKPKKIKGSNSNALEYKLVGIATEKPRKYGHQRAVVCQQNGIKDLIIINVCLTIQMVLEFMLTWVVGLWQ